MCGGGSSKETIVSRTSRMSYFGLFLITVIGAWVFRDRASPALCSAASDIFW